MHRKELAQDEAVTAYAQKNGVQAPMNGERRPLIASPHARSAEEVVEAALYLASPTSTFVTGSALVIDGGLTAA
jgi:NAD(P)-dependent dehydrogenase (short-subunit alcohol dehydrogenase family)